GDPHLLREPDPLAADDAGEHPLGRWAVHQRPDAGRVPQPDVPAGGGHRPALAPLPDLTEPDGSDPTPEIQPRRAHRRGKPLGQPIAALPPSFALGAW